MKDVLIYSFEVCPYCEQAKALLKAKEIPFVEKVITRDEIQELSEKTGMMTVPQIFFGDTCIGGFTELLEIVKEDKLNELLNS